MKKCPWCGEENVSTARFCNACGGRLAGASEETPTEESLTPEEQLKKARAYMNGDDVEEDLPRGARMYRELAEEGYAPAICALGRCYLYGWGVEEDAAKGVRLLKRAADAGVPEAFTALGHCCFNGKGTEEDQEQALFWYQKGARAGNAEAQNALGVCYIFGQGTEANAEDARYWFQQAAENGDEEGMYHLGVCYENGDGVERDPKQAAHWYLKSAEKGYAKAEVAEAIRRLAEEYREPEDLKELGLRYLSGDGVGEDESRARSLFEAAAEGGCAEAVYHLAKCYYNGWGAAADEKTALSLFKKAAEADCPEAQVILAQLHEEGSCGAPRDDGAAYDWYCRAARLGSADAQRNVGEYLLAGKGTEKNTEEGLRWLEKAAENGDVIAMGRLAVQYGGNVNPDVATDLGKRFHWIKAECENSDDALSHYMLYTCYNDGKGTEPDETRAFDELKKSVELGVADELVPAAPLFLAERCALAQGTRYDPEQAQKWLDYGRKTCIDPELIKSTEELMPLWLKQGEVREKLKADPENADLQYEYAVILIPYDRAKTVQLLEKLAQQGHEPSQNMLIVIYQDEKYPEADLSRAGYWLMRRAESGDAGAMGHLSGCYANGSEGFPEDEEKSFHWLKRAHETKPDDLFFMVHLGLFYIDGTGTARDVGKGRALVERAARAGDGYARERLGVLCWRGVGGPRDLNAAEYWLKKALESGYEKAGETLAAVERELHPGKQRDRSTKRRDEKPRLKGGGGDGGNGENGGDWKKYLPYVFLAIVSVIFIVVVVLFFRSRADQTKVEAAAVETAPVSVGETPLDPSASKRSFRLLRKESWTEGEPSTYDSYLYTNGRLEFVDTYTFDEDYVGETWYSRDERGNVIFESYYPAYSDYYTRSEYLYDDAGRLVTRKDYSGSEELEPAGETTFEYDAADRLVTCRYTTPDGGDARREYYYDGRGLLEREEYYFGEDASPTSVTTYEYDGYGRVLRAVCTEDQYTTTTTNEYDRYGNLIHAHIDAVMSFDDYYIYTPELLPTDPSAQLRLVRIAYYESREAYDSRTAWDATEYEYDPSGRVIEARFYDQGTLTGTVSGEDANYYESWFDALNARLDTYYGYGGGTVEYVDGRKVKESSEYESTFYSYNDDGTPDQIRIYTGDGKLAAEGNYEYDDQGQLTRYAASAWEEGYWYLDREIVYEYDDRGDLVLGLVRWEDESCTAYELEWYA